MGMRRLIVACVAFAICITCPCRAFAADNVPSDHAFTAQLMADGRLNVAEVYSFNFGGGSDMWLSWKIAPSPADTPDRDPIDYEMYGIDPETLPSPDVVVDSLLVRAGGEEELVPAVQVAGFASVEKNDGRFVYEVEEEDAEAGELQQSEWFYDAENHRICMRLAVGGRVEVTVNYHVDGALWLMDDCAYLPWNYGFAHNYGNAGRDNKAYACLVSLSLPDGADTVQEGAVEPQGFIFADDINALEVQWDGFDATALRNDEAYFVDGTVRAATTLAFSKSVQSSKSYYSTRYADFLTLNLVMPRSWFADDAAGVQVELNAGAPMVAGNVYSTLVDANDDAFDSVSAKRAKDEQKAREQAEAEAREKASRESVANGLRAVISFAVMAMLVFLIGGFVAVLALWLYEFLYQHRPDPRPDVESTSTREVPDRRIHPLVFDELFYHEYDPEERDFETEMVRLAALGLLEVEVLGEGTTGVFLKRGAEASGHIPDRVDAHALGVLFGGVSDGERMLSDFKREAHDDPQRVRSTFMTWKNQIVSLADDSGYMQVRDSPLAKLRGWFIGVYAFGALIVAMFLNWLIALFVVGVVTLILKEPGTDGRIVLTKEGSRLRALGEGYRMWLEQATPEEVLDCDDRELADRLTYMTVFARDTWGPGKIGQVTALRPDDPRMRSVRACYCTPMGKVELGRVMGSVAHEVTVSLSTAVLAGSSPAGSAPQKKPGSIVSNVGAHVSSATATARATADEPSGAGEDGMTSEQVRVEFERAEASLDKWRRKLEEARAAVQPASMQEAEKKANFSNVFQKSKANFAVLGVFAAIFLVFFIILGANPRWLPEMLLLYVLICSASIRGIFRVYRSLAEEDSEEAERLRRERKAKEDRYRELKDSIPVLEQKVADCEREYERAKQRLQSGAERVRGGVL